MNEIGFSTGSLAMADFRLARNMLRGNEAITAIELSALREEELLPLIESLDTLDLEQFSYISFHAPSRLTNVSEESAVDLLRNVAAHGWPIILHPDAIGRVCLWEEFGALLCIENMDKRKRTGRTAVELSAVFSRLPAASLCFDIGHARQIDPTMCEAECILRAHGYRLRQLHVSEVTSRSRHEVLSWGAVAAYQKISGLIPQDVPVILETPVPPSTGSTRKLSELKRPLGGPGTDARAECRRFYKPVTDREGIASVPDGTPCVTTFRPPTPPRWR